jgi:hypothetical protein
MKYLIVLLSLLCAASLAQNEPRLNYAKLRDVLVESRDAPLPPYRMAEFDAFARARVSSPIPVFESKLVRDKQPGLWDELTTGGGSASFVPYDAMVRLSLTNSGSVIRQTYQRFVYQPGQSQLILLTGIMNPASLSGDTVARYGSFTASPSSTTNPEGIWFQVDATNIYVCIGKPQGTDSGLVKIPRERWNEDKLDGSGPSKKFVDFSKAQIFGFDYEWLGVGSVRFFIVQDNQFNVVHRFRHANELSSAYLSTPNLPLRIDLQSTTGTGHVSQICGVVHSEPGREPIGRTVFVGNASNTSYSTSYGILTGFRSQSNYLDRVYLPQSTSTLNTDQVANYQWLITRNTKFQNPVTWVANGEGLSIASPDPSPVVTNLGIVLVSGFVAADASSEYDRFSLQYPGSNIAGQPDEYFLIVRAINGTPEISGGINLLILE